MRDAAEMYGLRVNRANKAICPFHMDTKPSLHIYSGRKGWYCFVCGQGGDVIAFVMKLFGLPFKGAIEKLNDDFRLGLPISGDLTEADRAEAERIDAERRRQREMKRKRQEDAVRAYHSALDRYIVLDTARSENAPTTPYDAITDEYAEACRRIAEAEYRLDLAEERLLKEERT